MHICVPFLKLKMILFYRALQTDFPTFAFLESKNDIVLRCIFVYLFLKLKMTLFYRALQTDFPTFAFLESKNDIVLIFVLLTLPCGANTCVTVRSALYERSFPALMTSSPVSTLERLTAPFIHSCKFCYCPRKILQSLLSKSLWSTVLKSSCVLMRFDIWCVQTE